MSETTKKLMMMQLAIVTRFCPCFHAALVIFGREDGNEMKIKKMTITRKNNRHQVFETASKDNMMSFSFRVKSLK